MALWSAGCAPSFAERYAVGNAALSSPAGLSYSVRLLPLLVRVLEDCESQAARPPPPRIVIVADVRDDGGVDDLAVGPAHDVSDCVHARLDAADWPRPPSTGSGRAFPVGLKVDRRDD